jgi:hypothetical protein
MLLLPAIASFLSAVIIVPYFATEKWWSSFGKEGNQKRFISVLLDGFDVLGEALQRRLLGTITGADIDPEKPVPPQVLKKIEVLARAPWITKLDDLGLGELRKTIEKYPMAEQYVRSAAVRILGPLSNREGEVGDQAKSVLNLLIESGMDGNN